MSRIARLAPVVLTALAALVAFPSSGSSARSATTLTFAPTGDARIEEASPSTNFGTSTALLVDTSPHMRSYLKFQVSGVSGTVSSAKLRLYAYNATTDGPALYPTVATWSESTITWNTRPDRTSTVPVDDKVGIAVNTWV